MPRRLQPQVHVADAEPLAPAQRLLCAAGPVLAQARAHQRQSVRTGEHRLMARARVIGVRVGNHRTVHRPQRIDEEAARLAVEALRQGLQPGRGMRHSGKMAFSAVYCQTAPRPQLASASSSATMYGTVPATAISSIGTPPTAGRGRRA